jgi:hypothetical protein
MHSSLRAYQLGYVITSFAQYGFQKCSRVAQRAEIGFGFDLDFLERYHKDGDEFLNHIGRVRGDETWVHL